MNPGGRALNTDPPAPTARRAPAKPRLAAFSPWPPKGSGVATYAARLVEALRDRYSIDLYHEPGYVPEPTLGSGRFGARDARTFGRLDRALGYRGVLYQMGNSFYHGFVHDALLRRPGVVTLHDYCLSGFQFWRAHRDPGDPFENLGRQMAENYPDRFAEFEPQLRGWTEEPGGFAEALARRGLAVNREVLAAAEAVIVHSPWCRDRIAEDAPELLDRVAVIPLGAAPAPVDPGRRDPIRARFDLPADALVIGLFGILTATKMTGEAIEAFGRFAAERPGAVLIFVGADWEGGAALERAEELGLLDRVRFLGRQPEGAYSDLIGAVDIGLSLRRPPTHGETSAALLDLLRRGVPTVVNDAGTFADFPDDVVCKVRWGRDGIDGLARALGRLADEPGRRRALGESALRYVRERHDWPRVAERYAEVIERVAAA